MNTLKNNQIQHSGVTWEVRANGNDIILDSLATDTMRVIANGWETLQNEVQDNLLPHERALASIQKIAEIAQEELINFAYDQFERSIIVQP